jgi:hypothetical protein
MKRYYRKINKSFKLKFLVRVKSRKFNILSLSFGQFNTACGDLSEKLENVKQLFASTLSASSAKNHLESIDKIEAIKSELIQNLKPEIDSLVEKSRRLTPFSLRRQKLKQPYNRCRCLIPYKKTMVTKLPNKLPNLWPQLVGKL